MNRPALDAYNQLIVEKYDVSRFKDATPIDCIMPGFFGGNDVLFIAQNPGELKEDVEGDQLYLRAYEKKEYDKLGEYYIKALKSSRGTYGTFINDMYGEDWSRISFTNVFKCPFVDNKIPKEIPEREKKILRKQIEFLNPKVIVAVGTVARKFVIFEDWNIKERVMYTDHPSYLKRSGTYEQEVRKDSQKLAEQLTTNALTKPV